MLFRSDGEHSRAVHAERVVLTFVERNCSLCLDLVFTQRPLAFVFETNLFGPALPILDLDVFGTDVLVSSASSVLVMVSSIMACLWMRKILILSLLMTELTIARSLTSIIPIRFTFPHLCLYGLKPGRERAILSYEVYALARGLQP